MTRRYTKSDLALLKHDLGAKLPMPVRRKRSNEESQLQRALIAWWHVHHQRSFGLPTCLLFSIPNGSNWDAKRGSIMKAEGQRKGAPDLMLAVPRTWTHGLFMELKRREGTVTPEQEEFHACLRAQSYRVEIVRTLQGAINQITAYITQ